MGGLSPTWVEFKYERLPIFCYWCGMINHDEKDCKQWMRSKESLWAEEKQYGPWLWATPGCVQKPQLVVALKYEGREEYKEKEGKELPAARQWINSGREVVTAVLQGVQGGDDMAKCRAEVA